MKEMTMRDRFRAVMGFKPFDRLPVVEVAPWWDETTDRWHAEGLPADVTGSRDIQRYFGLDLIEMCHLHWAQLRHTRDDAPVALTHGGAIVKNEAEYETVSEFLYSLTATDWKTADAWSEVKANQAQGDTVTFLGIEGFFWFPRTLLGIEGHMYGFYDQPELIHRMNREHSEWLITTTNQLFDIFVPDVVVLSEDMSYNHGPMLSKTLFNEFMRPYYDRVVPHLKKCGTLVLVDSDGDVTEPASWFEEAGIDGIWPLERQAGVDIARLRAEHPEMRFMGHFDKMTMSRGEDAMRAEFERLLPTAAAGGYVINCDHQTPPGVSFENYQIYVRLFREYAEKAGAMSQTILSA